MAKRWAVQMQVYDHHGVEILTEILKVFPYTYIFKVYGLRHPPDRLKYVEQDVTDYINNYILKNPVAAINNEKYGKIVYRAVEGNYA